MKPARVARALSRRRYLFTMVPSAFAVGTDSNSHVGLLCSRFLAPCCWHENLNRHSSPQAEELRGEIRRRVAAGETDDQIKQDLVRRFTSRILTEPEGAEIRWPSRAPWLLTGTGMFGVSWIIWRSAARLQPETEGKS